MAYGLKASSCHPLTKANINGPDTGPDTGPVNVCYIGASNVLQINSKIPKFFWKDFKF